MSQDKDLKKKPPSLAKYIAENQALYALKFNFLPPKQIRGKLEEQWRKMYDSNVVKVHPKQPNIPEAKVNKPEIKVTAVSDEPLKSVINNGTNCDTQDKVAKKSGLKEELKNCQIKSENIKPGTTIELLSEDNQSVGFIEYTGSDAFLRLHNGELVPWTHSTPVRLTRNNTHRKDISRLPFSPI